MTVRIGRVDATVHATDSEALLHPRVMEQVVQQVTARVKDELEREKRRQRESIRSPRVDVNRY